MHVTQRSYRSVASIRKSDHKAVTAEFFVTGLGSGRVGSAGDVAPSRRGVGGAAGARAWALASEAEAAVAAAKRGGEGGACALR